MEAEYTVDMVVLSKVRCAVSAEYFKVWHTFIDVSDVASGDTVATSIATQQKTHTCVSMHYVDFFVH